MIIVTYWNLVGGSGIFTTTEEELPRHIAYLKSVGYRYEISRPVAKGDA